MDHIEQLKKIRTDAILRLRNSPDFKLAGKLGLLIVELGETVADTLDYEVADIPSQAIRKTPDEAVTTNGTNKPFNEIFAKPKEDDFTDLASDKMIDELVAEIEGDVAELDAIMAEDTSNSLDDTIGPFLKPDTVNARVGNGAAH